MQILDLHHAWFIFWVTYLGGSLLFPNNGGITRRGAHITRRKILAKLAINCAITRIMVPVISYIPQCIFLPITWYGSILRLTISVIIAEIWFYYTHRLMHHKWVYRWHSDHHAFIQPYAFAGLYCSPVEMIIVNQMTVALPCQILGFSFSEIVTANIIVALSILRGHAGLYFNKEISKYRGGFMLTALDHDIHHRTMTHNFGLLYVLDRLHGTYRGSLKKLQ